MSFASSNGGTLKRTPPRPLSEAVSQPDIFHTPDSLDPDQNISLRKRKFTDDSCENLTQSMNGMFKNVLQMFKELKSSQDEQFSKISQEIKTLKNQNENLLIANTEIKSSLTTITEEQTALRVRVEKLEQADKPTQNRVIELEEQLENLERKARDSSVEINNLPTDNHDQMMAAIKKIHETLNIVYDPRDIRSAFRITTKTNRPRPIIIEYVSTQKKITIMRALKEFNNKKQKEQKLNSTTIGLDGEKRTIFINELLTKKARLLHYLAREFVKNSNWKFCWTARGKVYVRREEGDAAIEIKSEDQISVLGNNTTVVSI